MLQFTETLSGVYFDVLFEDRVNLFSGVSGEGKTFLFTVLKAYLAETGVSCIYLDNTATDFSEWAIKEACTDKSVIIFDNADLYLTQSLLDFAIETADTVIISMKNPYKLVMSNVGFYSLDYETDSLYTNRENLY